MSDDVMADLSASFDQLDAPAVKTEPERPNNDGVTEEVEETTETAETTAETTEEAPEATTEEKKPLRAPEGLKPEFKVRFAELDPEWQEEILRREQDAARGINELSKEAKLAKELDRAIAPYEPMIQMMGAPKAEIIQNMLQTAYVLNQGSAEQKAAVVRGIMDQYGIELRAAANDEPANPEVAALKAEIAELKGLVRGNVQQDETVTRQQAANDLQAFATNPENEFFNDVRVEMGRLMGAGLATDLKDAYDKACRLNPEVLKAIQLKEQRQGLAAQARAAKAAKESARQVTGSGPTEEVKKVFDDPRDDVRALLG